MKYIILESESSIGLAKAVVEKLEDGWELQGGVTCSVFVDKETWYTLFAQAMMKKPRGIVKEGREVKLWHY